MKTYSFLHIAKELKINTMIAQQLFAFILLNMEEEGKEDNTSGDKGLEDDISGFLGPY